MVFALIVLSLEYYPLITTIVCAVIILPTLFYYRKQINAALSIEDFIKQVAEQEERRKQEKIIKLANREERIKEIAANIETLVKVIVWGIGGIIGFLIFIAVCYEFPVFGFFVGIGFLLYGCCNSCKCKC